MSDREIDALARVRVLERENERLLALINTPELQDFSQGVTREAAHQRERWGLEHDLRKEPEDHFWVLGWLSGKIVHALRAGDVEKAKHHCISSAALLANWHHILVQRDCGEREGIVYDAVVEATKGTRSNE